MKKKKPELKTVENDLNESKEVIDKSKFEITPEIMDQLLNGKLKSEDKAVDYLIGQLIVARQQYDKIFPQIQQKEKELTQLKKALHEIATRWETLQMDICNLWPN